MRKELLKKYLNNSCTEKELEEAIHWFKTESLSREGKKLGLGDWESYVADNNSESDERFTGMFDKIQKRINENNPEKETHRKSKEYTLRSLTILLTRAAAILFLPVLGFLFYTLSMMKTESIKFANMLEVVAPVGSRTIVQLSDGSKVHLNYGSKLKYPQFFSGSTREVKLEGEGYFEVFHNPKTPFIVKAGSLNLKALGTDFNVLAYADDDVIETTLVNGKVVLEQQKSDGKIKVLGAMEPVQHVNYNLETETISFTKGSVEKYIAWKEGKLVFKDASIFEVTKKFSRMFNVDIEVADDVKEYVYTVTFMDEPLFQMLDLMTIATPISYKTFTRKKLPDGTFSKQKILIEKKLAPTNRGK